MTKRIRFVSNGHGEDSIASKLIPFFNSNLYHFIAFPLVGLGHVYERLNIRPMIRQQQFPSGGFLRRPLDVVRDLFSGLLSNLFWQRKQLMSQSSDFQIVVGDVFALMMACWRQSIPTIFLPTAKSERSIPHSLVEFILIKRYAMLVFPRDIETHHRFLSKGIQSYFFGNPMFDGIRSTMSDSTDTMIGLLPGSRDEMVGNMQLMLSIVEGCSFSESKTFMFALPPGISATKLKEVINNSHWSLEWINNHYQFRHQTLDISIIISDQFFDVLHQVSVVIGLAGTANEQAMFVNRPLISFIGTGPQSTKQRFIEQHQLIDGSRTFFIDSSDPSVISRNIESIFNDEAFTWTPLPKEQHASAKIVNQLLNFIDLKS